jgi:uncharacterized protein YqeY
MSLHEQLSADIKAAMMARDAERLGPLRLLKSALGYVAIEKKTDLLPDADFIAVVQKEVKKRRDAIEQFEKGGRPELAAKEQAEAVVLEQYLPKPLSPAELEALVRECLQETGATSKKDMGLVMRAVQSRAAGRADGKAISQIVGRLLT